MAVDVPKMPCYLFTYHSHGSWMPDRAQGYVRRGQGILPPDSEMAERYRRNAKHEMAHFREAQELCAIDTLCDAVSSAGTITELGNKIGRVSSARSQ